MATAVASATRAGVVYLVDAERGTCQCAGFTFRRRACRHLREVLGMTEVKATEWHERLREPFPPEMIHQLPKGGVKLDYVGHAEVTDRLLSVDPEWSWEPFALDERGLPAMTLAANGNPVGLWIRLTVKGVTRIGFGSVMPTVADAEKQLISDALRNAAMRFGVALDLWAKSDLHEGEHEERPAAEVQARREALRPAANGQGGGVRAETREPRSEGDGVLEYDGSQTAFKAFMDLAKERGGADIVPFVAKALGSSVSAKSVMEWLNEDSGRSLATLLGRVIDLKEGARA